MVLERAGGECARAECRRGTRCYRVCPISSATRADGDLSIRPSPVATRGWRSELAPSHFSGSRRDSRDDRLKCPVIVRPGCRFWHFWFWRAAAPRPQSSLSRRARPPQNAPRRSLRTRVREARADVGDSTARTVAMSFGMGGGAGGVPNPNNDFQVANPPGDGVSSLSWSPTANFLVATSWACDADNVLCYEVQANGQAVPKAAIKHDASVLCSAWNHDGSAVFSGAIPSLLHRVPRPSRVLPPSRVRLLPRPPPRSPRPSLRSPRILVQAAATTRRRSGIWPRTNPRRWRVTTPRSATWRGSRR